MQVLARHRRGVACLVLSLAAGFLARPMAAQAPAPEALKLRVGDTAPDFKMQYIDGKEEKEIRLSDYRGKKNVVLAFYIFAFTGG
jgi:hypothetical protein